MNNPIASLRAFWSAHAARLKAPVVAIAGVGAVLSGLVGYYTTYRTVAGTTASVAVVAQASALPTIERDPSIAVLPLVNMSSDKEQEYFSDGMSEELLNLLAKVPKLRVIARTSSFGFKGTTTPIDVIARKLNVASILEGSVRRSGDKVRIKLQLIRASDSSQLWSETYDRPLDDIFKVQDEIASAVVGQLKVSLLGAAPKTRPVNTKAYELILQANAAVLQFTPQSNAEAIRLFEQALAISPAETRALTGLAAVYILQANTSERPLDAGYRLAREMSSKALSINPDDARAHAILGRISAEYDSLEVGASQVQRALALDSTNNHVLGTAAIMLLGLARVEEAVALAKHLVALDPANPGRHQNLGYAYSAAHQCDLAIAPYKTALTLSPNSSTTHFMLGRCLLNGKADASGALAEMLKEPNESWRLEGLAMTYHALGRKAESDAALSALIVKYEANAAFNVAEVLAFRGETDRAFEWLKKAVANHDSGLINLPTSVNFDSTRQDPRWLPFMRKIGRAPEQLAAVKFKVELPK